MVLSYPTYVQDIMGDIFSLGFGPFRCVHICMYVWALGLSGTARCWVCAAGLSRVVLQMGMRLWVSKGVCNDCDCVHCALCCLCALCILL